MELRNYQQMQLDFLNSSEFPVTGLESPTGTGKSIVILQYIKEQIKRDDINTIVITTGFNELVFQLENDAKELFDLDVQVLAGAGLLRKTCDNSKYSGIYFERYPVMECTKCPYEINDKKKPDNCAKKNIYNFLNSNKKKIIITNHSYFIIMKDVINADLLIVDEAHTFGDFYMSSKTIKFEDREKKIINDYLNSHNNTPIVAIFNLAAKNDTMNVKIIKNLVEEIKKTGAINSHDAYLISYKIERIFAKRGIDSFLEKGSANDFVRTEFYNQYDITSNGKSPKTILVTATLDDYTMKMFRCTNKNQIYRQRVPEDRYVGSEFVSIYEEYQNSFVKIFREECMELHSGLILSTTNENVNWTVMEIKTKFPEFEVFTKSEDFKKSKAEHKVLVGSRGFFQGVNIPGLDFVILDKLPFEVYDNKFRAYSYYIEKTMRENAWTGYTLPLVKNTILQALGRLWRVNKLDEGIYDQGKVLIFDPRLKSKMHYLEDFVVKQKKGISLSVYDKDRLGELQ